jgi:hypothetical protein
MIVEEGDMSFTRDKEGRTSAGNQQDVPVSFQFGTIEGNFEVIGEVLDAPERHVTPPKGSLGALGGLWWAM